jgi:hypothetical protein
MYAGEAQLVYLNKTLLSSKGFLSLATVLDKTSATLPTGNYLTNFRNIIANLEMSPPLPYHSMLIAKARTL